MFEDCEVQKMSYRIHNMVLEDYIESGYRAPDGVIIRGVGGPVVLKPNDIQHLKLLIAHYEGDRKKGVVEEPTVWTKNFGTIHVKVYYDWSPDYVDGRILQYDVSMFDCTEDTPKHLREFADWLEEHFDRVSGG